MPPSAPALREDAMPPSAQALREHVLRDLLPFWGERGLSRGGFLSQLTGAGAPTPDRERRLLVQTRQLFAFSAGASLALGRSEDAAHHGDLLRVADRLFAHLVDVWHDRAHGGFFHTATPEGAPLDRRKDSYGHAFAVFALSHYHAASGEPRALELARETWERVGERLRDRAGGGYFESAEADWTPLREGPRRQNPHMHWLEALLSLHERSADTALLDEARALVALLESRWLEPTRGALREHFAADWTPLPEKRGRETEPGHHYEWTWLLLRYAAATGDPRAQPLAQRLFTFAERHGLDSDLGVFDAVDVEGGVLRDAKRLWPQTERVKALAARRDLAALRAALEACFTRYATRAGGWREHLDRGGAPLSPLQNATSVYHVVLALREAIAALEETGPAGGRTA